MEVPTYSPREIVSELDRFIVGQNDAKRAVAIALRNRWRRQQLPEEMREEVVPKNILMIGPTGCGKTEIARRLAKLAQAPFLKVEATKFTEVGYVGRDVESIARDLVEASINMLREASRKEVQAQGRAGGRGAADHRAGRRRRGGRHALEIPPHAAQRRVRAEGDRDRGLRSRAASPIGQLDIPGMPPGQVINLGEMMKGMFGGGRPTQKRKLTVEAARRMLEQEEADRLLDNDRLTKDAVSHAENNGIVFIDEIDKVGGAHDRGRLPRRRRLARGRAARPAAADRGHHGQHEVRAGEDRPRAVHRLGRVPSGEAVRPAAGAAGPAADPRGAGAAVARRSAADSDRAGALAAEAVLPRCWAPRR